MCIEKVRWKKDLFCHYTGLPDISTFDMLYALVEDLDIEYYYGWKCTSALSKVFLTLMKLGRNLSNDDLAFRFCISASTVSNIFLTWIHVLHAVLFDGLMKEIPSRHKNKGSLATAFKDKFEACRIILDCTEVFVESPKMIAKQNAMCSSYKHHNTLKGLVGIDPNGTVTFCSRLYPGATSDKAIVADSGIISKLNKGDLVLADKGFLIGDLLPEGVSLNIPPFRATPQCTPAQAESALHIAQARIHVERAIQRIKTFLILQMVPQYLVAYASTIFQLCCMLTNFKTPLLQEVADKV